MFLIDVSYEVRDFITHIDGVIDDFSWDAGFWVLGYNRYFRDADDVFLESLTQSTMVEDYIQRYPFPVLNDKDRQMVYDSMRADIMTIATYCQDTLYPAMHVKMVYRDTDRPYIHDFTLQDYGRIECHLLYKE